MEKANYIIRAEFTEKQPFAFECYAATRSDAISSAYSAIELLKANKAEVWSTTYLELVAICSPKD